MHPYTQALLSAVPIESPNLRGKRAPNRPRGRCPEPRESAVRLPLSHALLEGAGDLRRGGAGRSSRARAEQHPVACHFAEVLKPLDRRAGVADVVPAVKRAES